MYEVEFEVLTVVDKKIRVLWDMAPCSVHGIVLSYYSDGRSTIVNSREDL